MWLCTDSVVHMTVCHVHYGPPSRCCLHLLKGPCDLLHDYALSFIGTNVSGKLGLFWGGLLETPPPWNVTLFINDVNVNNDPITNNIFHVHNIIIMLRFLL